MDITRFAMKLFTWLWYLHTQRYHDYQLASTRETPPPPPQKKKNTRYYSSKVTNTVVTSLEETLSKAKLWMGKGGGGGWCNNLQEAGVGMSYKKNCEN